MARIQASHAIAAGRECKSTLAHAITSKNLHSNFSDFGWLSPAAWRDKDSVLRRIGAARGSQSKRSEKRKIAKRKTKRSLQEKKWRSNLQASSNSESLYCISRYSRYLFSHCLHELFGCEIARFIAKLAHHFAVHFNHLRSKRVKNLTLPTNMVCISIFGYLGEDREVGVGHVDGRVEVLHQ